MNFAVPADHKVKLKESKKKDKYLDIARELEKLWNIKVMLIPTDTGTGIVGNKKTNVEHPNYSIIGIGQNTKKSPGNLRRLAVTQNPMEKHQLTLM